MRGGAERDKVRAIHDELGGEREKKWTRQSGGEKNWARGSEGERRSGQGGVGEKK